MNDEASITGGCLCGSVRYEARGAPLTVAYCHCLSCRRHTGAPLVVWVAFESDRVHHPNGERARKVMLLTLPSGRELPVNYLREGDRVYAGADGRWWRELAAGNAPVTVPDDDETVATAAAWAAVSRGTAPGAIAEAWNLGHGSTVEPAADARGVRAAYADAASLV